MLFSRPSAWNIPLSSDVYFANTRTCIRAKALQLLQDTKLPSIRHRLKFVLNDTAILDLIQATLNRQTGRAKALDSMFICDLLTQSFLRA